MNKFLRYMLVFALMQTLSVTAYADEPDWESYFTLTMGDVKIDFEGKSEKALYRYMTCEELKFKWDSSDEINPEDYEYEWSLDGNKQNITDNTYTYSGTNGSVSNEKNITIVAKVSKKTDEEDDSESITRTITITIYPKADYKVTEPDKKYYFGSTDDEAVWTVEVSGGNPNGWQVAYWLADVGNRIVADKIGDGKYLCKLNNIEATSDPERIIKISVQNINPEPDKSVNLNNLPSYIFTVYTSPLVTLQKTDEIEENYCGEVNINNWEVNAHKGYINKDYWKFQWQYTLKENPDKNDWENWEEEKVGTSSFSPKYTNNTKEKQDFRVRVIYKNTAPDHKVSIQDTLAVYTNDKGEENGESIKVTIYPEASCIQNKYDNYYLETIKKNALSVSHLGGNENGNAWICEWYAQEDNSEDKTLIGQGFDFPGYTPNIENTTSKKVEIIAKVSNINPNDNESIWWSSDNKIKFDVIVYNTPSIKIEKNKDIINNKYFNASLPEGTFYIAPQGGPEDWDYEWHVYNENGNEIAEGFNYKSPFLEKKNDDDKPEQYTLKAKAKNKNPNNTNEYWWESPEDVNLTRTIFVYPKVDVLIDGNDTFYYEIKDETWTAKSQNGSDDWKYEWTWDLDKSQTSSESNFHASKTNDGITEMNGNIYLKATNSVEGDELFSNEIPFQIKIYPKINVKEISGSYRIKDNENFITINTPIDIYDGWTIKLEVEASGGNIENWTYVWNEDNKKVGQLNSDCECEFIAENKGDSRRTPNYSVLCKNEMPDVDKEEDRKQEETKYFQNITIWPKCIFPEKITVQTVDNSVIREVNDIYCVREGNDIKFEVEDMKGGYAPNGDTNYRTDWSTTTDSPNKDLFSASEMAHLSEIGNKMYSEKKTCQITMRNVKDNVEWDSQMLEKDIIVYRRPTTPESLEPMGINNITNTYVVTMPANDAALNSWDYYLVFGYIDANGNVHDQEPVKQESGTTRWFRFDHLPSGSKVYVYSMWKYADNAKITSGKRYMDSVDEKWDGSDYSAVTEPQPGGTRAGDNTSAISYIEADTLQGQTYIYTMDGHAINDTGSLRPGIYIKERIVNGKKVVSKMVVK